MREPPPTPVIPTKSPTASPETAKTGSMPYNIVEACRVTKNLMSIELLDFWLDVNSRGRRDRPSSTLFDGEISAASDDQRRPDQRRRGRPLSKHHHTGNDHPDELSVGKRRQSRRGGVPMGNDQHSVAGGAENTHHGHDCPNSH